ncbi:type VII secretion system-associated protein [Streptomyces sp. NPDC058735]|uniref:type VII secretion system-associated protein n=1 Tax=unclassified Streptomyces TaxID=2593676 RepID=UPI0036C9C802
MADNPPAVNLNKAWLQDFLDEKVTPFLDEIKKMRENGKSPKGDLVPGIPNLQGDAGDGAETAPGFYDGQKVPLAIGMMATEETPRTNGNYVITSLNGLVDQLDEILRLQVALFEEIEENLKDTIAEMFKTQDDNLEKIDGKKFIDFFEGADEVLSESSGGSNVDKEED